ncbi:MFS transporter [Allohahella marinimesophila]|uniref:MFS transporter n=2 Tax=Allohahella marinimesophila TaxID=1054972 RepID=A0ABP7NN97_9GAMM
MYDWANSVYSLIIATAIFPVYYVSMTADITSLETIFGAVDPAAVYSFSLTLAFLIVALGSPVLSAIADRSSKRHYFLMAFCSLGSAACVGLFWFDESTTVWLAVVLSVFASIGFWGSIVFYNAYLPEIAEEKLRDELSARGFAMGYFGSSLLLVVCLAMILGYEIFGFENAAFPTRLSFLLVGIWWFGFAMTCIYFLPKQKKPVVHEGEVSAQQQLTAMKILQRVAAQVRRSKDLRFYLLAYFFFSTGVQTIFYVANLYGANELELPAGKLIATILVIQIIAIVGALSFSRLSARLGNLRAMQTALAMWALLCGLAFLMDKSQAWVEYYFYALGAAVGLVMGGIQSLARSTYSKLLPPDADNTTFYSFYDVLEKIGIVLGTLLVGVTLQMTGSMKPAILMLGGMFILSLLALIPVREPSAAHQHSA